MDGTRRPYEGKEPYIFVSYARKDAERVYPFLDALAEAGYRVWWDAGISAGEHWTETLVEKVEGCQVFCPLFSEAFNASRFCFEETEYAFRKDKSIVPVYLEQMNQKDLRPLFRLLGSRQDLRVYWFDSSVDIVKWLEREKAFSSCKTPEWNKIGQIQWRLSKNGILTVARNEDLPDNLAYEKGTIPHYQYDPVHECSIAPWMPSRGAISTIVIQDNIDTIGDYAFTCCQRLNSIQIGNGVKTIGKMSFAGCNGLFFALIPNNVFIIDDSAFRQCKYLLTVRISDSVTNIGKSAFAFCENLADVSIGNSVTTIGDFAFCYCESLYSVRIPDSIKAIGEYVFQDCHRLNDVFIPDSVTSIGRGAFRNCWNLADIEIPTRAEVEHEAFPAHTHIIRRPVK